MSTHIDVKHVIVGAQSSSGTPLDNPTPAATPSPVICYYYDIHIKETLTHVNPNQMSTGPLIKSSFATVSTNFERSYYHDTPIQIPTTPRNTSYYRVEKKITRTPYNYTGQEIGQPKIKTSTIYVGNPSNVDHNGICIINIDVDNDSHLDNTYIDDNHSDNTYNRLGIDVNHYTHGSVCPFQSPSAAPFDDFCDNSTSTVTPFDSSYYNPMQTTTFSSIPDHYYLIIIEERVTPFNSNNMPTGQSTTETSYATFSANFEHSYDRGSPISTANSFVTSSSIPSYCCVEKEITKTLYKSNPTEQAGPPKTENLTFYI
ncbi:3218_t:CDS:1 [Entrophospora sp. SA101]|nr:10843_t:CDS:1 [Entrophospora sp. SA101]CAJ0826250.1 3218_t:CDS:1 [Entrophospora sp. SA101]